ncbi:MAG: PAS domain S-box protein [Bacteroidia bacterium]|nr:PAS domain S-box protein [Bacteroidia bacterium]
MTQTLINYHKLIEKCTHMLFQLGRMGGETVVVRVAGLLSRALGLENEAVEGKKLAEVFGYRPLDELARRAFEGHAGSCQFKFAGRYLHCNLEPYRAMDVVTDVIGTVFDISQIKAHENRLLMQARAMQSLNDAVVLTDAQNRILYVNPAFGSFFGYDPEEVVGREPSFIFSALNDPETLEEIIPRAVERKWTGNIYVVKRTGTDFLAHLTANGVTDPDEGTLIGFVYVIRDAAEDSASVELELQQIENEHGQVQKVVHIHRHYVHYSPPELFPDEEALRAHFPHSFFIRQMPNPNGGNFLLINKKFDKTLVGLIESGEKSEIGAYYSLLTAGVLKQMFYDNVVTLPEQVLAKLHFKLSPLLQVDFFAEEEDLPEINVGVASVTKAADHVKFSGANCSLFLARGGKIRQIPGEEAPIQVVEGKPTRYFRARGRTLLPGDTLYLFTRSIPRALGGDDGEIYGMARFIEFLQSICSLPTDLQRHRMEEFFDAHYGTRRRHENFIVAAVRI